MWMTTGSVGKLCVVLVVLLGWGAGSLSLAAAAPPFEPTANPAAISTLQARSLFDFVHGSQSRMIQLALVAVGIGIFILVRK